MKALFVLELWYKVIILLFPLSEVFLLIIIDSKKVNA